MAKKKRKSTTRRRRRVSGIGNFDLQGAGLAVAGAFAANKLTAMLSKQTGAIANLAPYAGVVAGVVLPMLIKSPLAKSFSIGLFAGGGLEALKKLNVISGPYNIPVVAGARRGRLLNGGVNNPGMIAGNTMPGGYSYSPARNSVQSSLSVISGTPYGGSGSATGN